MTAPHPSRRAPRWQLVVAAVAATVTILGGVVLLVVDEDDSTTDVVTGTTTSTATPPTSTTSVLATTTTTGTFTVPPPQERSTTTTSTTTSTTSTTTSTTSPPTSTTTSPPPPADPGPLVETSAGDHTELQLALDAARARWRSRHRPDGYVYRTRLICFCPQTDNEITVDGTGTIVDQRTVEGEAEYDPRTIDELFELLQSAIDRDAASIRARFERIDGYPVDYFVDYDERLADEEQGREIDWVVSR